MTKENILRIVDAQLCKAKKLSDGWLSQLELTKLEDSYFSKQEDDQVLRAIEKALSVITMRQTRKILYLLRWASSPGGRRDKERANPLWWPKEEQSEMRMKDEKEIYTAKLYSVFLGVMTKNPSITGYFKDIAILAKCIFVSLTLDQAPLEHFRALWTVYFIGDIVQGNYKYHGPSLIEFAKHEARSMTRDGDMELTLHGSKAPDDIYVSCKVIELADHIVDGFKPLSYVNN
ncbi:hypothetical protein FHETE_11440, partial [Fusarium heterosporum]